MIVFTWVSTSAGGAERSIRVAAAAIRAAGHPSSAVELRYGDAACTPSHDAEAKICTKLADYEEAIAGALISSNEQNRVLVSNHRSWTVDAKIAQKTGARLYVVIRGTPVIGASIRILVASGRQAELETVSWEQFQWPRAQDGIRIVLPSIHSLTEMQRLAGHAMVSIVPNPIDDVWFKSPAPNFAKKIETVVSASRYVAWKGIGQLACEMSKTLMRTDSLIFQIFGAGPELPTLERYAASVPAGRFCVNGWVDALWEEYSQSSVYVSCSTLEAFGRSGAEAMASGLPLIVPAAGGLGEMVRASGAGFAFDPECEGALEQALLAWHVLPAKKKSAQGLAARAYAHREFRAKVIADRWLTLSGLRSQ